MAKQVENRVVEMEFKNKDFEKAVSVTMKSLEELNKKLDDLNNVNVSGFERMSNSLNNTNFDKLSANIDYIRNRFGFLGEAVHDVWGDIINGAEAAVAKLEAVITKPLDIIEEKGKARATNIAQAKFQLTNLGVEWEKIKPSIDEAVNDTRFGMDEAAMAASQLVASGVELGDEMTHALLGISGVAAMTNSEYSDIAHIFTTIAGTGKVYTQQLNMIASRGLNVTAALADYMGITEQEVREIIADKDDYIDFFTFAEAMWDQYGESAKKGNDLFSGALSNAKAALGRIGEKFYTPFYEYARQVLVSVKPVINDINNALNPIVEASDDLMFNIKRMLVYVLDFAHAAFGTDDENTVFYNLFGKPIDIKNSVGSLFNWIAELITGISSLFEGWGATSIVGDTISNILYNLYQVLVIVHGAITDVFGELEASDITRIGEKVRDFTASIRLTDEQAENLQRTLRGLLSVVNLIWKTASALFQVIVLPLLKHLGLIGDDIFEITGDIGDMLYAFDQIYDPFGPLYQNVQKAIMAFAPFGAVVKKTFSKIGAELSNLTGITDIETFFTKLGETVEKLHIEDAFYMIGGAIVYCIQQLGIFLQMFNDSSSFKEYIHSLAEQSKVLSWIQEKYTKLKTTLNDLFSGKITLVQALGLDKLAEKFTWLTPIIDKFKEHYRSIFDAFEGREGREGLPFITLFGDKLKEAIKNLQWEDIYGAIGAGFYAYWIKKSVEIKSAVAESFNNFVGVFKTFTEGINMSLVKLQKETNAEKILKIAASVALLAGSVYLLAGISSDDILKAVGAVAALMLILTVFIGFLGKFTQSTKKLSEESNTLMDPGGKKTTKTKGKGKNAVSTIVENLEATLTETKTTVIEKIKNFGELPALILSLAAMIGIIALAIGHLANVAHADPDAFHDAVSVTFLILGAVAAIAALFVTLSSSSLMANPATISAVSKYFLAIGALLNLLVVPIVALTGLLTVFHNGEVFVAVTLVTALLAAFAGIAVGLAYFINVANAGAVLAGAGAMVLMAAAIALMTIPLVAISTIAKLGTLDDAFWTIGKLIFEMGAFVAIFAILGQTVTGSVGMLAGGASMILMAAAINSLIIPLAAITALVAAAGNTDTFEKAKTTIMRLMGLMAIIAAVFGGLSGGFGVAGAAGVIAVAGMVAGAAAMILIAKAIQALIIPLAAVMALQKAGNIDQAFMDIAKGIAMLAAAAIVVTLISPALGILIGLLQGLAIAALAVGTGIRNAGQGILFLVSALALLQTINFETLETKIVESVGAMIRGFKTAISAGKPQISEGFLDLLGAGLAAFVGSTGMIAEACIKLLLDVIVVIDSHAQEIGFHLGHALTDILFYALLGVVGSASDLLIRAFGGKGEFSKQLMEDLFPKKESEGGLVDSIKGIFGGNKAKEAAEEATAETGEAASQSFANNFNIPETEIQNKLDSTFENFDVTKIAGLKGQEGGDSLLSGLSESLEIKDGQSFAAANQATMFDEGFLNGSKFNLDDYRDFGKARMSSAFEGMQEEADSHSPSRRAMELAGYIDEGFAIGLENSHAAEDAAQKEMSGIFSVISSASDVANKSFDGSALDNIRESILGIANSANADDLNPTITPVLDMSNVQSGFASLDSMFNRDRSISLAGEVNGMNAANKALSFEIQNGKSDAFNNGFSTLGTKFDRFSEAMMNRQIVLDSGELVGGLVNPMDRSLGVRAIRAQRGGAR